MAQDRVLSMIGLAMKAGKVARGAFLARQQAQEGASYLVVLARDASDNTKKRFYNLCRYYDVPCLEAGTCESLGHILKKERLSVLSIGDKNLARAVQSAAKL